MWTAHRLRLLVLSALFAAGCSGFADPDAVSEHVSKVTGVGYSREGGLTVGKNAMRLARIGVAAAGEQSPDLLEHLDSFAVGVYRAVDPSSLARGLTPADFSRYEAVLGLEVNSGEEILLLSRSSRGSIRELLAVIDGRHQLTVVQVRGDLENILEEAVRIAFARAERNDLTTPVLDSLAAQSSR